MSASKRLAKKKPQSTPTRMILIILAIVSLLVALPFVLFMGMMTVMTHEVCWEYDYGTFRFEGDNGDAERMYIRPLELPTQIEFKLSDDSTVPATELTVENLEKVLGPAVTVAHPRESYEREGLRVYVESGVIQLITVDRDLEIKNRTTGKSIELRTSWSEVRKAFGSPKRVRPHVKKVKWGT